AATQVRECLHLNAPVSRRDGTDAAGINVDRGSAAAAAAAASGREAACGDGVAAAAGGVYVSVKKHPTAGTVARAGKNGDRGTGDGGGGEGEGEVVRADAVIVTVPLSVLQEGDIEFEPPLPEAASSALSRLRMGNYEKIVMEYAEPFWPADAPFSGCCCPPQPSPLLHAPPPSPISAAAAASAPPPPPSSTTIIGRPDASAANAASTVTASAAAAAAAGDDYRQPAAAAAVSAESCPPSSLPAIPLLLENYLWSKGVPVLTAAVIGARARQMSADAAVGEGEEEEEAEEGEEEDWRASHAREMYRRLIKPALVEGLCGEGRAQLPEPVSVAVTRCARDLGRRKESGLTDRGDNDDGQNTSLGS
ncbi:unnamed protein product, partial [Hapterophycus canaliculatus]